MVQNQRQEYFNFSYALDPKVYNMLNKTMYRKAFFNEKINLNEPVQLYEVPF
jgi:hypothetical protein